MSAPSLAVTAIRLAVYTKKIWLACDVCALVGCDRRRRAEQLKILGLPAMSVPLLAVTAIWLAVCHFPGLKPVDCRLLAVFELI
jgi:hypothetical protein